MVSDGQHRAACLYHLNGGQFQLPVIRLHFKNEMHNTSYHPWIDYLFKWNGRRIKRLVRITANTVNEFIRNLLHRLYSIIKL